ncbi:MAG TPA: alpha-(1-_3)-arabinofuranosyltransferase family protein [Patescibacteria group bacterium]|nr:alpha-(1->3)-arabinofuranosyltransferase family protein [Patescibacteria group bacterium]
MRFLAWGDFLVPFNWASYWSKYFYMWSFQSGTANPDGLIRLPGRLPDFIAFGLFGNVGASYFYILASLLVAFISFFVFARNFLHVNKTSVQIVGALFFACNPIFLGNVAKIGLVLAAAMLPFCLLAVRAAFQRQQPRFLLWAVACLNISFLHPYTFAVNTVATAAYFIYLAWHNQNFLRRNIHKLALVVVLGLLANFYFILPTISMGTVSKDVISTNITPTPADYTALVGVSNTGNLFTGLSLSKDVFVDFSFYDDNYQSLYFFGVFVFYVIVLGLYLRTERRLSLADKRRLGVFFTCFIVLVALATVTIVHLDALIKLLIGLPGGWAFRSPLKWQLYIPLTLFSILVILLNRVKKGRRLVLVQAGLLATFLIMNGYVATDMYHKILTLRTPQYFAGLQALDLSHKTALFVNNADCLTFMRNNPAVTTEFNQIMASKEVQLKNAMEDEASIVDLANYDYIIGCDDHLKPLVEGQYDFASQQSFVQNTFHLYANQAPTKPVYVASQVFASGGQQSVGATYNFVTKVLQQKYTSVTAAASPVSNSIHDVFASLTPTNIQNGSIEGEIASARAERWLFVRPGTQPLFYGILGDKITLSTILKPGLGPLPAGNAAVNLPAATPFTLTYTDPTFDYKNLVPNPSLEQGLWQHKVGDCYNFDDQPEISMKLVAVSKTAGRQSLELDASNHIACTGPGSITVQAGAHYLLSFDYQSIGSGRSAGYHVQFDDHANGVVQQRLPATNGQWRTMGVEIAVPAGASHLALQLYAYPDPNGRSPGIARYDQVSLTRIPPTQGKFYVINAQSSSALQAPKSLHYRAVDPTRQLVAIRGAAQPFYVAMNQTYDSLWQVELQRDHDVRLPFAARTTVPPASHVHINDTTNGWYIDPAALCGLARSCIKEADGSYDFNLAIEFVPQRWFYLGGVISIVAAVSGVTYYLWERHTSENRREGLWRRRK